MIHSGNMGVGGGAAATAASAIFFAITIASSTRTLAGLMSDDPSTTTVPLKGYHHYMVWMSHLIAVAGISNNSASLQVTSVSAALPIDT